MGYVAGTHFSDREFVDIFNTPGAGRAFAARHAPPQYVAAQRGDVIFHSARTVHMAMANRSAQTRAVHTAVYFRDGCTRSATGSDLAVARNGTRPGEPIDGPATPIAWPLTDGQLPSPPTFDNMSDWYKRFAEIGVVPKSSGE
jgi:hypothetical protein